MDRRGPWEQLADAIAYRDRTIQTTTARVLDALRTPPRRSDFTLAPPPPESPRRQLIHNGRKPR